VVFSLYAADIETLPVEKMLGVFHFGLLSIKLTINNITFQPYARLWFQTLASSNTYKPRLSIPRISGA